MRFEPSTDTELIQAIMAHPAVYIWISDDASLPREMFSPVMGKHILYLLCFDEKELLGLWMFVQINAVTLEVHTCLLPTCKIGKGRIAAKEAAEWIWDHTSCERIITNVPEFNRAARKFAKAAGMVAFGFNPLSFLKNGALYGQLMLGISRPPKQIAQKECA